MRALILAGGRGSRLGDATNAKNKAMLEFEGRPLIEFSLESAVSVGVNQIVILIGYLGEQIINRYGNSYHGIPLSYVIQWETKGVVHAIEVSREALGGEDFMLFLADEVVRNPRHKQMVEQFEREKLFCICGVVRMADKERIRKTYSMIYEPETNRVFRLIEKPRQPINDQMGTGNCIFSNRMLDYVETVPINQIRGEKEMPDLIQSAVDDGHMVKLFELGDDYVNVNTLEDWDLLKTWRD